MFLLFFNSSLDVLMNYVIIKNEDSVKEALAQMKGVGWGQLPSLMKALLFLNFPFPTHGQ